MRYNACMEYPTPNNTTNDRIPYDDSDLFDADEAVAELMQEGYTEEEARRMVGEFDSDDTCYGYDDLDRDLPSGHDFVDEEDFD